MYSCGAPRAFLIISSTAATSAYFQEFDINEKQTARIWKPIIPKFFFHNFELGCLHVNQIFRAKKSKMKALMTGSDAVKNMCQQHYAVDWILYGLTYNIHELYLFDRYERTKKERKKTKTNIWLITDSIERGLTDECHDSSLLLVLIT